MNVKRLTEDELAAIEFFAWPHGSRMAELVAAACQEIRERRAADMTDDDYQELLILFTDLTMHDRTASARVVYRILKQYEAMHADPTA